METCLVRDVDPFYGGGPAPLGDVAAAIFALAVGES